MSEEMWPLDSSDVVLRLLLTLHLIIVFAS